MDSGAVSGCPQATADRARYARLSSRQLVSYGVPADEARLHDIWLLVSADGADAYSDRIAAQQYPFVLSALALPSEEVQGYVLRHVAGSPRQSRLGPVLETDHPLDRIPSGYVPFSLDDLTAPELTDNVAQQLAAFSVSRPRTFSSEDVCRAMIPVWDLLDLERRGALARSVHRVVRTLARGAHVGSWLQRQPGDPPLWRLVLPGAADPDKFRRALKAALAGVERDLASGQQELPLVE